MSTISGNMRDRPEEPRKRGRGHPDSRETLSSWSTQELYIMLRHVRRCGPRRLRELCSTLESRRSPADVCAAMRELQTRADRELRRRAPFQSAPTSVLSKVPVRRAALPGDPLALWASRMRLAPGVGGPAAALRLLSTLEQSLRGSGLRAAYLCASAALEGRPASAPSAQTVLFVRAALVQVAYRVARAAAQLQPARRLKAAAARSAPRKTDTYLLPAPDSEDSVISSLLLQPDFNPLQLCLEDCRCE